MILKHLNTVCTVQDKYGACSIAHFDEKVSGHTIGTQKISSFFRGFVRLESQPHF